jgi:hypothetical protein
MARQKEKNIYRSMIIANISAKPSSLITMNATSNSTSKTTQPMNIFSKQKTSDNYST